MMLLDGIVKLSIQWLNEAKTMLDRSVTLKDKLGSFIEAHDPEADCEQWFSIIGSH